MTKKSPPEGIEPSTDASAPATGVALEIAAKRRASMASERAADATSAAAEVTAAEATADWSYANCASSMSTLVPIRAEVAGARSRTGGGTTGPGSTGARDWLCLARKAASRRDSIAATSA